jgi:FtsH-binding integral membrane protein
MLRFTCLRNVKIRPLNYSFRNQARVRRDKNFITEAEGASHIPGYSTGAKLTAGCAALGIGALAYNGLNVGNNLRAVDRAAVWPQYIKQRIGMSYQYLAQGLVITALSSMAVIRSPRMMSLAASGGWLSLFGTIAGMVGLQIATRASPYDSNDWNVTKHGFWAAHAGFMGFVIAPLIAMFGDVVAQAALYTAGITGGISLIGATAPSQEYLNWAGPVGAVAGCILIAALASPFFSPTSPAGGMMFSFLLWGGLCLSGFGIFVSTQRMIDQAERHPQSNRFSQVPDFDPINASLGVYVNMVMMFQRIVMIMGMNKRK